MAKEPLYPHIPKGGHRPANDTIAGGQAAYEKYAHKIVNTPRMIRMRRLAAEVSTAYAKCCRELGLNPERIHDDIEKAPSYRIYLQKIQEYAEAAKEK